MEGVGETAAYHSAGRPLSHFAVELDVYSGPYEGLLTLILREELEIFEVPLRELVGLYRSANPPGAPGEKPGALERDTDFVDSATSLVLLKGRALTPAPEADEEPGEDALSPEDLEERLLAYLEIRRGAEALRARLSANADFYPSGHALPPRPGSLRVNAARIGEAFRRTLRRTAEPEVGHLGPISVTIGELAARIQAALMRGPVSFEDLIRDMDRLRSAVAFAAALSLASEGRVNLSQPEPFGPLTLEPTE